MEHLFLQTIRKKNKDLDDKIEDLKLESFDKWDEWSEDIKNIKESINKWLRHRDNDSYSAEIKSLEKIQKRLKDELKVYLLTSDTILSNVAAEIIKEYFKGNKQIDIRQTIHIEKLQVSNAKDFSQKGLVNLISKIEKIADNYYENVIFNITGGYKAVIPYMTIMAQINQCDIYYIFEDTDTLIKIPKTPIRVDYDEIEKNYSLLKELENGVENYTKWKNKHYSRIEKIAGFIETDEDIAFLSPMGRIFLSKYEQKYFTFYAPDEVWTEIKQKEDIKRIIKTKFCFKEQRDSQSELKNQHLVFDDGKNKNRIFYFEENGKIYIYKVFTNHDEYERYLNRNEAPKIEIVKSRSQKRKIEKGDSHV